MFASCFGRRSLREGLAELRGEADREAEDARPKVHLGTSLQRDVQFRGPVGANSRVQPGCASHGLRQRGKE